MPNQGLSKSVLKSKGLRHIVEEVKDLPDPEPTPAAAAVAGEGSQEIPSEDRPKKKKPPKVCAQVREI